MKFRVERDVLAEAVAWTARSLPSRPPVPVLAGLLVEASRPGRPACGCPASTTRSRPGSRSTPTSASRVGSCVSGRLLADIARSLPARPVEVVTEGDARSVVTCGITALHAADAAGRRLPDAARHADRVGNRRGRGLRQRCRPGRGRRRPRRHAAGPHRDPGRDRRREADPGGHRPLPAGGARAHLGARAVGPDRGRARARAHARRHGQGADLG